MAKDIFEEYIEIIPEKLIEQTRELCKEEKLNAKETEKVLQRVRKEYEDALIDPGESIGIITAESFGEPSTQMSIAHYEKILIKINDKTKIVNIGEFIDELINLKGCLKINEHSEILPLNDFEIYVPSLNKEEKIEWKRVIECSRHKTNKKLIKLITASGREITATDNHSFVTRINNSIIPVKGSELKIGDRIPILNNFFTDNTLKEIKVREMSNDNNIIVENDLLYKPETNTKPIKNTIELDWKTGWFIGAYLSEGFANKRSLSISNINDIYMENAKQFVNSVRLDYVEDFHNRGFSVSRDLNVSSTLLSTFIVNSCGQGSFNKKVPEFAYSASNEFISGLLRGYFDGDGNFHVDRKMIRVSSNSKELTDGIALLLSRFKIFSFKIADKKGQYWLLIPYKYTPLFLTCIGSDIDYKLEALENLAEKSKRFWNEKSVDYTDMISGFGDLFYRTAKKLNYPTRYINNFTKRQKIGRTALYRYVKIFENLAKEKDIDISGEIKIMNRMFHSDIIWDSIEKIEYVDYDHEYVYDLSVPGLETFTTFDGIITHNTLNVFHFAGVAEVAVTLGLPRLIELFDARKSPSTPVMDVYIKKQYSKDEKKVREIASMLKETKLADISEEFSLNLSKVRIEVHLSQKKMRDLKITNKYLLRILNKRLKGSIVKISKNKKFLIIRSKKKEFNIKEFYQLKEKAKDLRVKGIKGINQVLPVKRDNEFVILCTGSSLKNVLKIEGVDETSSKTNDIFTIADVLGIEAARNVIINEASEIIKEQGLDIDIRHIMFLADVMTNTGVIKGITRGGITSEKESVLARASFETPIVHIVKASLTGEEDKLNSVVENVMVNQPVPVGTGLPGLTVKMDGIGKEEKENKKEKK